MTVTQQANKCGRRLPGRAVAVLLLAVAAAGPVVAQTSPPRPTLSFAEQPAAPAILDPSVQQASCTSCGGGLPPQGPPFAAGCASCGGDAPSPVPRPPAQCQCGACSGGCCGGNGCYPGREPCYPCDGDTSFHRFLCGLYGCICCPDPCYEPRWMPVADAAFFVEGVRPVTQTRLRWDSGQDLMLPDRSEYFWARADGMGKGPTPPAPYRGETRVNYNDLSLYTEAGTGKVSMIFEMPYRAIDPGVEPDASGFGDMNIGLKTLLFDCELLQVSMIMRTYLPVGNAMKGLGTGHTSLEPSLLVGLCLGPETYLQTQIAQWVPLGGDPSYEGSVLHYHFSLNQVVWRVLPNVPLVGTMEFNGWTFEAGDYTDPVAGPLQESRGTTYVSLGAGLRLFVCDRIDFGFAIAQAVTSQHFADQLFRTEFRFRY